MTIKTIGFDADDTLWHNEYTFREAETEFARLLGIYGNSAIIKERLFLTIKDNLALYGYGFKAFILSMIETALELGQQSVSVKLMKDTLELGHAMMDKPVRLIEGVIPVLDQLKQDYQLVLISKGDLVEQERKVMMSGTKYFFDAIEIVSHKDKAAYEAICKRLAILPEELVMVGNSIKSDILPALETGARAVHVPYDITWVMEQADEPSGHQHYYKIKRLDELPALLRDIASKS